MQPIDPAVHDDALAASPSVLHHRRLADVERLLEHVQLAQRLQSHRVVGHAVEPGAVLVANVLHVAQPVVGDTDAPVQQGRLDAAATVVANDDDVLHLQHVDGELHHAEAVQIRVHHHVGDVAVHEQLARQQPDDLVGRHAAVGAADPQVLRFLLAQEVGEEAWRSRLGGFGPAAVAVEQLLQLRGHEKF